MTLSLRHLPRQVALVLCAPLAGWLVLRDAPHPPLEAAGPPAEPPLEVALAGRIFGSGRAPLAAVDSVGVFDELGAYRAGAVEGSAFRVERLAPGRHWLHGRARGFRETWTEFVLGRADATLDLAFVPLQRVAVRVRTPDGRPHPLLHSDRKQNLVALATREAPEAWIDPLAADVPELGLFEPAEQASELLGTLDLDVDAPFHASLVLGQAVIASVPVAPGTTEVSFSLPEDAVASRLGTIRVHVVDAASGEPVPGADVQVAGGRWSLIGSPKSGPVFECPGLLPGIYVVVVTSPRGSDHRRVLVEPGAVAEFTSSLAPDVAIEGRVRRADGPRIAGEPFGGVVLGRWDPATGKVRMEDALRAELDDEGRFRLRTSRDRCVLRAVGPCGVSGNVPVDATGGDVRDLDVVVHAPVPVALRLARGSWDGLVYRVLDPRGLEAESGRLSGPAPLRLALAPGAYRLLVVDAQARTLFEAAFVASEEPVLVPVEL